MTSQQLIQDLKKRQFAPVYLLMGDEPYFIDEISGYIAKNILNESEQAFNQVIMYGKDSEIGTVINAAKRFPMMSEYTVVIVREAQELKDIDKLYYYTDNPLRSTILVIDYKYKKLDKRSKVYKSILKNGVVFESKKLYDNQVPGWIDSYLKGLGRKIDPKASLLLTEFLGSELSKITGQLDKLLTLIPEGELITVRHIEDNIGISKDFNNLELQKAITDRDVEKAFRIVAYFNANPNNNPLVLTLTSLYFYFNKILTLHTLKGQPDPELAKVLGVHPFFLKDYKKAASVYPWPKAVHAISMLREYDLRSKGIGNGSASHGELLRELVFFLLK